MSSETNPAIDPQAPAQPAPAVDGKVELPAGATTTIIDFNEIKKNSVIVIKIAQEHPMQRMAASQQIAMSLRPQKDLIKDKEITFILMGSNESFDVLNEEQMNSLGWHKKEESRIITPGAALPPGKLIV